MSALDLLRHVDSRIEGALARMRIAVRGVLSDVDGGKRVPLVGLRGLADEARANVEVFQGWGFRSSPPPGVEAVAVQVGGRGGHLVVIATADRGAAPTDLASGDTCIYSAGEAKVIARASGDVEVVTAGGSIVLTAAGVVQLAGGGAPVARVGDAVSVTGTDGTGAAITATGIISAGSARVQAG